MEKEKDEGYSSGDSDSTGITRSSFMINIDSISTGGDPNIFKKDKTCNVCNKAFSLLGAMKKHSCRACFRGVCSGCSKHSANDSIKGKSLRICDSCYQKVIQNQVRENLQKDLDKEKNEILEIQKTLNAETERRINESHRRIFLEGKLCEIRQENSRKEKELVEKTEKLNKEIKIMEEDIEELTKILSNSEVEKRKKDEKISILKNEIANLKGETQNDIDKIGELKKLIEEQETENENLTKELNSHTDLPGELDDPTCRATLLDGLKQKINQAKDQYKELKKENEGLKKKLSALKEENSNKKAEISKLEEGGERKRSMSRVSTDIKELEDQIGYQDLEIARLQERLKNSTNT